MDTVNDGALVPRGDEAEEARQNEAWVRERESWRRRMVATVYGVPWAGCVILAALFAADRYEIAHHPFPKPEIYVAVQRGPVSMAIPVGELTGSEEANNLNQTISGYIMAREGYMFGARATRWRHLMALSAPIEQARISDQWNNPNNPDNPDRLYGTGLKAGWSDVDPFSIEITQDHYSKNFFVATFRLLIVAPDGKQHYVNKFARMEWRPAPMDAKMAGLWSALGVGCWAYTSSIQQAGTGT